MKIPNTDPLLILASKSPRRRYLLEQAGLKFSVIPSSIDETRIPLSSPETYVRILSEVKADDIAKFIETGEVWIRGVGGDDDEIAIVYLGNRVYCW